ncbi:zinc finger protein 513-like isoform X1 [Acanthochromis polyacanthus]|uniref:Zinc finger protein 513 n=1 Tax=Acanthochromis polyacanthus TaxID=80966 RepID=A0A3Q1GTC9_9TELE|nr:zinc finger protein 513 isoform X1 [Acanthochromis polyacanthus]XP_051799326.1 zinc finger protein 513-like isoform X1 [Acanthochromis polyacanthus]
MPRRKQSNPQPVKLESEDGAVVCDPSCLVLESDFLLSGELEFGDSEIMGLDREAGVTVFSLSVEDDSSAPTDSTFPAFLSCKGCGQLLGETPLGAGLDLGVGLDLAAELYCLTCEESFQHSASMDSSQMEGSNLSDRSGSDRKRRSVGQGSDLPAKLFSCSLCAFTSRYSNHLKRHMRIHDGHKPFRCPVCPYASAQLVNLQRHGRTHTGEKPYRCPQCSYACSSLGNLRRHQRMHTQERPQRREKEKRRGRRKKAKAGPEEVVSDLTLRLSQDSGYLQTLGGLGCPSGPLPVLLFPLCCRVCGLTLEEADLEGEKAEGEAEGDGGQMCRRCSLDLLSKDVSGPPCSLDGPRGPRRGQRGSKLYRCPRCPFLSHYPNHLARHSHTHSEEKPHRCPHCTYTSSHLDNLKRHLRVHTGEKPYQCPSCSYACGNLANLRRHERIHSGAKPFHCGVCGYSCNQSMNLKRHMLRHTGEKPYACNECSYTTGHWDNYKRHQRKHGHNTDSWDKHTPINGLSWGRDGQEDQSQGQEHK